MIQIFGPERKSLLKIWAATLLVANVLIGLTPQLSWANMVLASLNLTAGLLVWQILIRRAKFESEHGEIQESGQRKISTLRWKLTTGLLALAMPLFFTGLFPWGGAHWFNLTVFIVTGCGIFSANRILRLHREQEGPPFKMPEAPIFLFSILAVTVFYYWGGISHFIFPHHISSSPAIALSGHSSDGQYRLRPIPGEANFFGASHLKWTVRVEKQDSDGEWRRFYPPKHSVSGSRPAHLSGAFIEGQWERALRARWTGPRSFEVSYLHSISSQAESRFGKGTRRFRYRCTIIEDRDVSCDRTITDPPMLWLFNRLKP